MLNQVELEQEMYAFGRARASRMMDRNETAGRANNNPYAAAIYRRFVLPLAEAIRNDITATRAGRNKAHVSLLKPMDEEAVAYLAVRNVLNVMLNGPASKQVTNDHGSLVEASARAVATAVGKSIYHELLLKLFEEAEPDLFFKLANDFGRRMSKSERHRMTVFKMQAAKNGIVFPEWGSNGVEQVGAYLVFQLEGLGLVETQQVAAAASSGRKQDVRQAIHIKLTEDVIELIGNIKEHVIETTPYFLPCVEPPKDWVSVRDGGFHTRQMRRLNPFAVRSYGDWDAFDEADMSIPLTAINALQRTAWRINERILTSIREVAQSFDMEEILSNRDFPAPDRPQFLIEQPDLTKEQMSDEQQKAFLEWKRAKTDWFTDMRLRGTKAGRLYTATTVAEKFKDFPAIYFVYFADFRGRLYAQTTGVSPQGSDMQKALLKFAEGKPLTDPEAQRWFMIHGANKFGVDKLSLDDRVNWVKENHGLILDTALNPTDARDWREADCPLQFLAWCQEYADWVRDPQNFLSHLPVGMDGSCNGLQNFSAMLRDEVGGRATNLIPSAVPNDIYAMVAKVTEDRLRAAGEDDGLFRSRWLAHGINRGLVKRSVMTLPYGSTRFSCADFIVGDYLKAGKAKEFDKREYRKAASYLSHHVWAAIADVVVKAREAMDWLQKCSKIILKDEKIDTIRWTAPSGFPVVQAYQEQDEHRINTKLCGNAKIRVNTDTDLPDGHRHRNGIAPNFIHSHDAAHLALVTVAAAALDLSLAMIHDDYGTHAADAAKLYRIIRETFVAMYTDSDPLEEFAKRYNLPQPPSKGNLDLTLVLSSPYFFS